MLLLFNQELNHIGDAKNEFKNKQKNDELRKQVLQIVEIGVEYRMILLCFLMYVWNEFWATFKI